MIVSSAGVHLLHVPLSAPYQISRGSLGSFDNVVLRLDCQSGLSGWGEAVPVSLTEDPQDFARLLRDRLLPAIIGTDIGDLVRDPATVIGAVVDHLLPLAGKDAAVVAAVDQALWDIAGRASDRSVGALIGAAPGVRTWIDYTMGAMAVDRTGAGARDAIDRGYAGVVVKITCTDPQADLERVRATCRALKGRDVSIRVDANGGFGRDAARRFLDAIRGLPVAFVEQPVAADDIEGMRLCRESGVPVAADESLKLPSDAERLVAGRACDVLNVKVTKAGGITQSLRVARIAADAGLPLVIGGGLTYGISRFASRHIAAAAAAAQGICHQGPGPASQALTGDITIPRPSPAEIAVTGGYVVAPDAPGMGCEIDPVALDRYCKMKWETGR